MRASTALAEVVASRAPLGSKSSTGSMIAAARLAGSQTIWVAVKVAGSKRVSTMGAGWDMELSSAFI